MNDLSQKAPSPSAPLPQEEYKAPKPRLKFANTSVRLHPDDLPPEYEPTEIYRGLDDYVSARRAARRSKRREARRIHRHGNEDGDSADDSDKEDGNDSDSSSSSSDDNGPMVISRLRALFGDSSDSSSSSSSSSEDSSSDDDASVISTNTSRRSIDITDHMSIRSGRSRRDSSATPNLSSAFPSWTPKLSALTGTRRRKKRRRRRLSKGDTHMVKSSRMARRNARRLRQLAGGITEYTIFSPTDNADPGVFTSQSWKAVRKHLDYHFQYLVQSDGHAGDLGLPASSHMPAASHVSPALLVTEEDEGDLALPPPALDVNQTDIIPDTESTWDDQESQTGRHMSDIPLTPFFRSALSGELSHSPMPFSQLAKYPDANRSSAGPIPTIVEEDSDMANLMLPEAALDIEPVPPVNPTPIIDPEPLPSSFTPSLISRRVLRDNPWWLDIRCPTYKVMQQLSLQFPLHPLTVEDILKQEQREKVELFERLGYYFVVVRALDEHYFRFTKAEGGVQADAEQLSPSSLEHQGRSSKPDKQTPDHLLQMAGRMQIEMVKSEDAKEGLEGLGAGSLSMYMVVFDHGVITFHFEDMSIHMNRVRDRLMNTATPIPHNADWIVHSLYDSIVDSFSPYVSFLQNEVDYIDSLPHGLKSFTPQEDVPKPTRSLFGRSRTAPSTKARKAAENRVFESLTNLPNANVDYIQYLRRRAERLKSFSTYDAIQQSLFILHLTRVREVVMGLNRLLLPKSDVIRGLRKRIVELHRDTSEESFIALYFDDITDHITSMLAQLQDREAGLNNTHSSFLTRASVSEQKFNLQKVSYLVNVTVFITFIFCIQLLCSAFGMNVLVPSDDSSAGEDPDSIDEYRVHSSFRGFGGIVAGVVVIPFIVYTYSIHLKRRSRIRSKQNAARW